ncbi:MAG: hypothetical protein JWO67_6472 [Streptosporangiaceae bacterium]|nr:hypothetical protein [Streptosporangiaceae bacterium]
MRRLLVAGFAALAVVLGLSLSVGTAFAAVPVPSDVACVPNPTAVPPVVCPPDRDEHGHGGGYHGGVGIDLGLGGRYGDGLDGPQIMCPLGQHRWGPNCVRDGGPIHGGYGGGYWHPGLPWGGPALYGHQLWLAENDSLDVCGFSTYDMLVQRDYGRRSTIDRLLGGDPRRGFYSLHQQCIMQVASLPSNVVLINGDQLNLQELGFAGIGDPTVCSYADWNVFSDRFARPRLGGRYGDLSRRFGGNPFNTYRQLRLNARCTTASSTTVIVQPASTNALQAAPAPGYAADPAPSVTGGNPAPMASSGAQATAPSGPTPSGGNDALFVLIAPWA